MFLMCYNWLSCSLICSCICTIHWIHSINSDPCDTSTLAKYPCFMHGHIDVDDHRSWQKFKGWVRSHWIGSMWTTRLICSRLTLPWCFKFILRCSLTWVLLSMWNREESYRTTQLCSSKLWWLKKDMGQGQVCCTPQRTACHYGEP